MLIFSTSLFPMVAHIHSFMLIEGKCPTSQTTTFWELGLGLMDIRVILRGKWGLYGRSKVLEKWSWRSGTQPNWGSKWDDEGSNEVVPAIKFKLVQVHCYFRKAITLIYDTTSCHEYNRALTLHYSLSIMQHTIRANMYHPPLLY